VKVLTYNIHGWQMPNGGGSNAGLVARVLAGTGADIVGLNEVFDPDADGERPLRNLAKDLGFHYAFGPTQSSDPTQHPPYGNAFLSRWPVLAYAAHHLAPETPYGKRGLLEVRILLPFEQPFTVYVTHLDHRSERTRLDQWAAASTWLARDRARPHVLMGDFNALTAEDYPTSDSLAALTDFQRAQGWVAPAFDLVTQIQRTGYVDTQADTTRAPTFPAVDPERRVDYIFASATLAPALRSCGPLLNAHTRIASDHVPVLAEFAFPPD
jgi:endonuclease/exonuclease/phosphatase family metal-dependent hydrolase